MDWLNFKGMERLNKRVLIDSRHHWPSTLYVSLTGVTRGLSVKKDVMNLKYISHNRLISFLGALIQANGRPNKDPLLSGRLLMNFEIPSMACTKLFSNTYKCKNLFMSSGRYFQTLFWDENLLWYLGKQTSYWSKTDFSQFTS